MDYLIDSNVLSEESAETWLRTCLKSEGILQEDLTPGGEGGLGVMRFALAFKAVFLALAVAGLATLWMAVVADEGASLLVTLNGMRVLALREGAMPRAAR